MDKEVAVALIGGAFALVAGIVSIISTIIQNWQKHKYEKEDTEQKDLKALTEGVRWILFDRIKYLGFSYMRQGTVDFDDRRILREMHKVYHVGLGGNGDLDQIMSAVDKLPLSENKKGG